MALPPPRRTAAISASSFRTDERRSRQARLGGAARREVIKPRGGSRGQRRNLAGDVITSLDGVEVEDMTGFAARIAPEVPARR